MRNKVLKSIGIFLIVAVLCTIISRGLYVASIADVTLKEPNARVLNHDIETSGMIEQKRKIVVLTEADQIVTDIYVKEGQKVKSGDPLFSIDLDYLKQQIDVMKNERKQLGYQIEDAKNQEEDKKKQDNLNRGQAKDNYDYLVDKWETQIAKDAEAVESAKEAYENSLKQETEDGSETQQLLAEWEEAQAQYEADIIQRDGELFEAGQTVESSQLTGENSTSEEQLKLQREQIDMKMEGLNLLASQEGKVLSDTEGAVSEILVHTGEATPATASILLSDLSSGIQTTVTLNADEAKHITEQSQATMRGTGSSGEGVVLTDVKIQSIKEKKDAENDSAFEVVLESAEPLFEEGANVSVEIKNPSKEYEICIPLEALHTDGVDKYAVYITEEQDTLIGKELTVRKVPVKILDKDAEFAAIENDTLSNQQKIIVSCEKAIEEGMTVKEKET